jgi:hypothetical protein
MPRAVWGQPETAAGASAAALQTVSSKGYDGFVLAMLQQA